MRDIETVEGDHSFNFDELLTQLSSRADQYKEMAADNWNKAIATDYKEAEAHYRRMYEAARFYRQQATK